MQIPPNMKRRAAPQPGFSFTELSLSDSEMASLCVIPSRAAAVPVPLPVMRANRRMAKGGKGALAAGMAFLALPACTSLTPPGFVEATVEAVQLARTAVSVQKRVVVSAEVVIDQQPAPIARGRTVRTSVRPHAVPPIVDGALLVRAERMMNAGQYKAALAMYQKLIRRQPSQVEALFGAALASHELKLNKGSADYLDRTLALRPDHPLANVLAGFGDQLGKRYGDARVRYSKFLSVEDSGDRAEEIRSVLASMPTPAGSSGGSVTGGR